MIANFFAKSKPINSVIITLFFLIIYGIAIFNEIIDFDWKSLPLLLFFFGAFGFINTKNGLTFDNSYGFLFLILLFGFFPSAMETESYFYANIILLFSLRKIYSLQSEKNILKKTFDAGFWLGVAFLIQPFSVVYGILIYAAIFIYNRFSGRTFLTPIVGFCIPLFLYFTYCFWFNETENFIQLFDWYSFYNFGIYDKISFIYAMTFISVFLLITIILKTPKALAVLNSFRSSWIILIINLGLSFFLLTLTNTKNGGELIYILFPSALILSNGIELFQKKKIIADIILYLFVINSMVILFI